MTRAGFLHPLLSPRQYRSRNSANQAYPVIQHAETIRVLAPIPRRRIMEAFSARSSVFHAVAQREISD